LLAWDDPGNRRDEAARRWRDSSSSQPASPVALIQKKIGPAATVPLRLSPAHNDIVSVLMRTQNLASRRGIVGTKAQHGTW